MRRGPRMALEPSMCITILHRPFFTGGLRILYLLARPARGALMSAQSMSAQPISTPRMSAQRRAAAWRRRCGRVALVVLWASAILVMPGLPVGAASAAPQPLKIGIIGAGKIGGTLATLWVQAGHEVLISSRHPDELKGLAQSLGPKAHVGTLREAALFGDVVLISIPYGALPQVGKDLAT